MSFIPDMFDINVMLSRAVGQRCTLYLGMTAGTQEDTISIDAVEIMDSKDTAITTKMANTIVHNIACALEDSKHHGTWFKVIRHQNDFRVVCHGTRGLNIFSAITKAEVKKMEETVKKCRADIKKIADSFGTETIQHVLNSKRMDAI
jgi:hypothetical protein